MGKFILTHKSRGGGVLDQITLDVDTEKKYGQDHFKAVLAHPDAKTIGDCPIRDGDSIHVEDISEDDE